MNQKSLTKLSKALKSGLLLQFPEWRKYVEFAESDFNNGKYSSFYIEIPSPIDKKYRLSILDRGDCVEVGFYDGHPPGPAERQIICEKGFEDEDVEEVVNFVREIVEEKFVVGREELGRFFSWLLASKAAPPQFIETNKLEKRRNKLVSITSWKGSYNWEQEK